MMQSKYDFALLNDWDGSLTLNEKDGIILSTMLGAGRKNSNNTFSGVLIGDVKAGTGLDTMQEATGVYGIHEGQLSYGFRDNGTGFIGKSGHGQILLDGNTSAIRNAGYLLTEKVKDENGKEEIKDIGTGMQIDLDNGIIDIKNNGKTKIHISPNSNPKNPDKEAYLTINGTNNTLMHIYDDSYYLQSDNYKTGLGATGTKLNLMSGELEIKNSKARFYASGGASDTFLSLSLIDNVKNPDDDSVTQKENSLLLVSTDKYYLQSKDYLFGKKKIVSDSYGEYYIFKGQANKYPYKEEGSSDVKKLASDSELIISSNNIFYIIKKEIKNEIEIKKITKIDFQGFSYTVLEADNKNGQLKTEIVTLTSSQVQTEVFGYCSPIYQNNSTNKTEKGFKLDLNNNSIVGYDLYLSGTQSSSSGNNTSNKFFILDSGAPTYPFVIGQNFKVAWDGSVICNNLKVRGTSNIGGSTSIDLGEFHIGSDGKGRGYWGGSVGGVRGYGPSTIASGITILVET